MKLRALNLRTRTLALTMQDFHSKKAYIQCTYPISSASSLKFLAVEPAKHSSNLVFSVPSPSCCLVRSPLHWSLIDQFHSCCWCLQVFVLLCACALEPQISASRDRKSLGIKHIAVEDLLANFVIVTGTYASTRMSSYRHMMLLH